MQFTYQKNCVLPAHLVSPLPNKAQSANKEQSKTVWNMSMNVVCDAHKALRSEKEAKPVKLTYNQNNKYPLVRAESPGAVEIRLLRLMPYQNHSQRERKLKKKKNLRLLLKSLLPKSLRQLLPSFEINEKNLILF